MLDLDVSETDVFVWQYVVGNFFNLPLRSGLERQSSVDADSASRSERLFFTGANPFCGTAPLYPCEQLVRVGVRGFMFYRKNVGRAERIARAGGGCLMIVCGLSIFRGTPVGWILIASGIIAIATGIVGFCPACAMVGRKPVE